MWKTKQVHWSEVITISSKQSKSDREFSKQILDFWQEKYPQIYKDIANTAEYRSGKKVEFGFGANGPDASDHFSLSALPTKDTKYVVNLSKTQSKQDGYISGETGILKRFSIEGVALHELIHAGDKYMYKKAENAGKAIKLIIPNLGIVFKEMKAQGLDVTSGLEALKKINSTETPEAEMQAAADEVGVCLDLNAGDYKPSKEGKVALREVIKAAKIFEEAEKTASRREEWTVDRVDRVMKKHFDVDRERGSYGNGVKTEHKDKDLKSYIKGNHPETLTPERIAELRKDMQEVVRLSEKYTKDGKTLDTISLNRLNPVFERIRELTDPWDNIISMDRHLADSVEIPKGFYANATSRSQKRIADDLFDIRKDASKVLKELGELEAAFKTGDPRAIRSEKRDLSKSADDLFEEVEKSQDKNRKLLSGAEDLYYDINLYVSYGDDRLSIKEAILRLKEDDITVKETKNPNHFIVGNYLVNTQELSFPDK